MTVCRGRLGRTSKDESRKKRNLRIKSFIVAGAVGKGMTNKELAAKSGMAYSTFMRRLANSEDLTIREFLDICDSIGAQKDDAARAIIG